MPIAQPARWWEGGSWAGSLAAGGIAAEEASPLLVTGPWGWLAYGVIVGGAGAIGYFVGGEVTETIYEWGFESAKKDEKKDEKKDPKE